MIGRKRYEKTAAGKHLNEATVFQAVFLLNKRQLSKQHFALYGAWWRFVNSDDGVQQFKIGTYFVHASYGRPLRFVNSDEGI